MSITARTLRGFEMYAMKREPRCWRGLGGAANHRLSRFIGEAALVKYPIIGNQATSSLMLSIERISVKATRKCIADGRTSAARSC